MNELQGHVERLQWQNDQLQAHMEKATILEKMYEIAVELRIRSLAIKGRNPLSLMMSIPPSMMSCPQAVSHL